MFFLMAQLVFSKIKNFEMFQIKTLKFNHFIILMKTGLALHTGDNRMEKKMEILNS